MDTTGFSFSLQTQTSIIRASLNGGMLLNFLMGVYTIVCAGTLYFYVSKRSASLNRRIVISTISSLYLLCLGDFIIQWVYINTSIVNNGDTRQSIFIATLVGDPGWLFILDDCFYYGVFLVSDTLLIWRCYQIWGMSLRMALIPSVFFIAECGLYIAVIISAALTGSVASDANAIVANNIQSAEVFVSLGTTLTATSLIGYKIYSSSRTTVNSISRGVFNRIVITVVESAAIYSLVILVYGIMLVDPAFGLIGTSAYTVEYYVGPMVTIIGGLAPTILVARIVLTETQGDGKNEPTNTHISGLQFHSQQETAMSESATGGNSGEEKGNELTETGFALGQDEEKMIH